MNKIELIKNEIKELHNKSNEKYLQKWFYKGHVEVVANYAEEISNKFGANTEVCILASLFHDIARTCGINEDPILMNESLNKTEEIMKKYSYSDEIISQVKQAIIPHSCKNKMPSTEEGKVLATADALAHLMTDFYLVLAYNAWLKAVDNFEDYKKWVLEKIDRDFHRKIFYNEYKQLAKERYQALKIVFTAP